MNTQLATLAFDRLSSDTQGMINLVATPGTDKWYKLVAEAATTATSTVATATSTADDDALTFPESDLPLVNRSGQPVAHADVPESWTQERLANSPTRSKNNKTGLNHICSAIPISGYYQNNRIGFNYNAIYSNVKLKKNRNNKHSAYHDMAVATSGDNAKDRLLSAIQYALDYVNANGAESNQQTPTPKVAPSQVKKNDKKQNTADLDALKGRLSELEEAAKVSQAVAQALKPQILDVQAKITAAAAGTSKQAHAEKVARILSRVASGKKVKGDSDIAIIKELAQVYAKRAEYFANGGNGGKETGTGASLEERHNNCVKHASAIVTALQAATPSTINDVQRSLSEINGDKVCGCRYRLYKNKEGELAFKASPKNGSAAGCKAVKKGLVDTRPSNIFEI